MAAFKAGRLDRGVEALVVMPSFFGGLGNGEGAFLGGIALFITNRNRLGTLIRYIVTSAHDEQRCGLEQEENFPLGA